MQAIRTLIVDDEPRIRRGIERLLMTCDGDWEVVATLSDGIEALEFLHRIQGNIDLLLTDVRMPEMDGLTLIKEAKSHYSFYPIMISGHSDFDYLQTAMREGAVDYFLKPLDRDQFRQRMAEVKHKINQRRQDQFRWTEMQHKERELRWTRQTQTLSSITSAEIELARLGYWGDDFPKGQYLLTLISVDPPPVKTRDYKPNDWKALDYALENIISEVTNKPELLPSEERWYWKGGKTEFWVLLQVGDEVTSLGEEIKALSVQIRSAIQQYTPFTVSVAMGHLMQDLYALHETKQRVLALMNYRLIYGGNQTFSDGTLECSVERLETDLVQLTRNLRLAVEQANVEQSDNLMNELFMRLEQVHSPLTIQRAVQNVYIQIHSVGFEYSSGGTATVALEKGLQNLHCAANFHVLKREIRALIQGVTQCIRQTRQAGSQRPVEQAKAFIASHYSEELSIQHIADHVYMNPSYFMRTFKTQTGITVLDYVTKLRMEQAKELLTTTTMKVQEVSEKVGYTNVKYFSRQFKQKFGETPAQYRESTKTL